MYTKCTTMRLFFSLLLLTAALASCKKNLDRENNIIEPEINAPETNDRPSSMVVYSCEWVDVPAPTTYTGLPTSFIENRPNGYGIFGNTSYDKGWKEGYEDVLFYLNYYKLPDYTTNACLLQIKKGIFDYTKPGNIRLESSSYDPLAGEIVAGMFMQTSSCVGLDFMLKSCIVQNAYDSKSLRLRYEFNVNYTGTRTTEQVEFDQGRLDGFLRGITHEPWSAF